MSKSKLIKNVTDVKYSDKTQQLIYTQKDRTKTLKRVTNIEYDVTTKKLAISKKDKLNIVVKDSFRKDVHRIKKDVETVNKTADKNIKEIIKIAYKSLNKKDKVANKTIKENGNHFYLQFYLDKTKNQLIFYNIDYLVEKKSINKFFFIGWLVLLALYQFLPLLGRFLDKSFPVGKTMGVYALSLVVSLIFLFYQIRKHLEKKHWVSKLTIWDKLTKLWNNESYFKPRAENFLISLLESLAYSLISALPVFFITNNINSSMLLFLVVFLFICLFKMSKKTRIISTLSDWLKIILFCTLIGSLSHKQWSPISIGLTLLASFFSKNIWMLTQTNEEPEDNITIKKKAQRLQLLFTALPLLFYLFLLVTENNILVIFTAHLLNLFFKELKFAEIELSILIFLGIFAVIISIISFFIYKFEKEENKRLGWGTVILILVCLFLNIYLLICLYHKDNVEVIKKIIPPIIGKPIRLGIIRTIIFAEILLLLKLNKQNLSKIITWIEYQVQPISDWLYTPSDKNKK